MLLNSISEQLCNFSFFQVIGGDLGLRTSGEVGGKSLRLDLIAYNLVLRYEGKPHKVLSILGFWKLKCSREDYMF